MPDDSEALRSGSDRAAAFSMDGPWKLDCFQNGTKIFSHADVFVLLNSAGKVIGYRNTATGLQLSLPVEPPMQAEKAVLYPKPNPSIVAIWQRR